MTEGAIRQTIVRAKAEVVEQMLTAISTLPLSTLADFTADPHRVAAGESYLRRALEALLDLGRHLLAKGFARAAVEYKEIPALLVEREVLPRPLGEQFRKVAGYRNRLVHFYDEVTPAELHRILTEHRDDVRTVLDALLRWVERHPERVDPSL